MSVDGADGGAGEEEEDDGVHQRKRGADMKWQEVQIFPTPEDFKESALGQRSGSRWSQTESGKVLR